MTKYECFVYCSGLRDFAEVAPIIWTQQSDVAVHTDWLSQHLMNTRPNHEQDIRTPSPIIEQFQTCWLEEARARPIQRAEVAELRRREREAHHRNRAGERLATESRTTDICMLCERSSTRRP
jgi:hypothetical protein